MKYVDRDAMRSWLALSDDVIADDTEIDAALEAAEEELETSICFRSFVAPAGSSTRIYETSGDVVYVDDAASFTTIEESDDRSTWTAVTDSWAGPENEPVLFELHRLTSWKRWVRVTAPFGYPGGPPTSALQIVKIRAASLLSRKDSPNGILGDGQFGISRVSRFDDPDIQRLARSIIRYDRAALIA